MITAIDTSVLIDVFGADAKFGLRSKEAVRACLLEGNIIACPVVWTEVVSFFPSIDIAQDAMGRLGIEFSPIQLESALTASNVWKTYRRRGGRRERVAADFLIGAHALSQAERLLTRDRGFYRTYFSELRVLNPSKP